MTKVYCDRCGKEITGNVNKVVEETEAVDCLGSAVTKWITEVHYCDECYDKELFCDFKVGDQVITSTGKVGTIIDICTCNKCKDRGFYEPVVKVEIGNGLILITDNDKRVNFRSFYKIGDHIFGNIDEDCVLYDIQSQKKYIQEQQEKLIQLEAQLDVIKKIQQNQNFT